MWKDKYILYKFYNFFGISCIKTSSKYYFEISKHLLFVNYLKFFFVCLYKLIYEFYLIDKFNIKTFFDSNEKTNFAVVINTLEQSLYHLTCYVSYILHNANFKKVTTCFIILEKCLNLDENFEKKYSLKCNVLKAAVIVYFISVNMFFAYFLSSAPYPASILLACNLYFQCYYILLYYFMKIFEEKVIYNFVQIRNILEIQVITENIKLVDKSFSNVFNCFRYFKKAYKQQFTINIGFYAISITFAVCLLIFSLKHFNYFYFTVFQFSAGN